jgi:hypothetical protein
MLALSENLIAKVGDKIQANDGNFEVNFIAVLF